MKILMLMPYLPYPLWSGGQIRSYNLLKNLSQKHEITLFSFIRNEKEREYIPELKKYCSEVKIFAKRPPWSFTSLTLSAVTFYPLVVCMYLRGEVKKSIAEVTSREHFDLIHAETFYVMPNIPKSNIPIILAEQTIEYLVYQHYTHSVNFLLKKLLMSWDVRKIFFWEKKFWQQAAHVVTMCEPDKKIMKQIVPKLKVDLVPNGVDTVFFSKGKIKVKKEDKTILFVGNFKWLQNREAVSILVTEIWPKIKKEIPDVKLWIVGKYPSKDIFRLASSDITVSDNIDDIREAYAKSTVLLAPIYGPGGTRYKILESMAMELPVVTTKIGIEGLGARHRRDALICQRAKDLSIETVELLKNQVLYEKLARNGRKLVEEKFSWRSIATTLDRIYQQASISFS